MVNDSDFSLDDKCFLFSKFKIDPSLFSKLPIQLAPGIHLTRTPQHALALAAGKRADYKENIALASWVYPGYGLGMGIVNACIKIDSNVPSHLKNRCFWLMMSALYLTKPLYINIVGSFSYGNEEDGFLGRTPERIPHKSNISLNTFFSHFEGKDILQYNESDLKQTGIYFSHFVRIFNSRKTAPRPYYVLKAFFEATLWERSIYASTTFSKLFPLIDAFVGNPAHKHEKKISKRLSAFLNEIPSLFLKSPVSTEELRLRIVSIWQQHRAPEIHGYLKERDFPRTEDLNQEPGDRAELKDLFDLMEISRLSIIKMLMLEEDSFKKYCQISIPRRQYESEDERIEAEQLRETAAKEFFEENTYSSSKEMIAFTDFVEYKKEDSKVFKEITT